MINRIAPRTIFSETEKSALAIEDQILTLEFVSMSYIVEHNNGACCGPYNTLLDAQNAAAAAQAAAVATDPVNLRAETTTDALTYYVVEKKTVSRNENGAIFTNTSDRVFDSYIVKQLTP